MSAASDRRPLVCGIGELLWDEFPDLRRPGGAPANMAYHAGRLGCESHVVSRVGADADGDALLIFLKQRGLSTERIERDSTRPTGTVSITLDGAEPDYVIHTNVAWENLQASGSDAEYDAICFGTLAQRAEQSRAAIQNEITRQPAECRVVFDVNIRKDDWSPEVLRSSLELAHWVKLNADEVRLLGREFGVRTHDATGIAQWLIGEFDLERVIVTRGGDGAMLITPDSFSQVRGYPVEVVDAVGAGDSFTAALVSGLLHGWPDELALRFANRVGGLVASHAGAMPELSAEVRALQEELRVPEELRLDV